MYNTIRTFAGVAQTATEYNKYDSRELIAEYREKNDDRIIALLALRVANMTRADAKSFLASSRHTQQDLGEAFLHALNYSISHYKLSSPSKWESFYKWCLRSTLNQMFVNCTRKKITVLTESVSIDDPDNVVQVSDESAPSMESMLVRDEIIKAVSNYPETINVISFAPNQSVQSREKEISNILESRRAEERRSQNRIEYIKLAYENPNSLNKDFETCIDLKIFKNKLGKTTEDDRIKLVHIYENILRTRSISEVSPKMLEEYGIICDITELKVIKSQLKELLSDNMDLLR